MLAFPRRLGSGRLRRFSVHCLAWTAAVLGLTLVPITSAQDLSRADVLRSDTELRKTASWQWPDPTIYEPLFQSFLEQREAEELMRDELAAYWKATQEAQRGPALLNRLLTASALVEPRIAELLKQLLDPAQIPIQPQDIVWLTSDIPGWLQDAIRLACGRAFAQQRRYDEALEAMAGLELEESCDPASLLFYRAASEHHLLMKAECLSNLELLLEREDEIPTRFAQLANLMEADIQPLEQDSLDEIARLMHDVERRLDLGRAGKRVRDEEQQIVAKLDKMIDQIEQQMEQMQQQQQQQQQSGSPQGAQQQPMQDSQVAGGSGPGDVDNKDIGDRAGWGNLPPAERQEALQRLTEELPSHYREVIEGYFRQLARER